MRRRFLRFAFNALSILSLLLCVGVCVLWVRSYRRGDAVLSFDTVRMRGLKSNTGGLYAFSIAGFVGRPTPWMYRNYPLTHDSLDHDDADVKFAGFRYHSEPE